MDPFFRVPFTFTAYSGSRTVWRRTVWRVIVLASQFWRVVRFGARSFWRQSFLATKLFGAVDTLATFLTTAYFGEWTF